MHLNTPSHCTQSPVEPPAGFDAAAIRAQFPVLQREFNGKPLVYLDNAATTQKPRPVIDTITHFYEHDYGTVRRGVYALCEGSTRAYEEARAKVSRFINAPLSCGVIFTKGTTEAINLVATGYGRPNVGRGDEVIVSALEHHANLVPWQQLCKDVGATLKVIPINDAGELDMAAYKKLLSKKTKLVAVTHVSNALGTVNPIKAIIDEAHQAGAVVLVDGAQAASHIPIDVQALDCDFYCFSGHKLYGPSGIGVLYAKICHLDEMTPYQYGGEMIESVTFEESTFTKPPNKFEAGTPPIVQAVGLGAAIDYVNQIGLPTIAAWEAYLLDIATRKLSTIDGLHIVGTAADKVSLISFVMDQAHPLDIGTILDTEAIAIRTGHHCAQPVMKRYNLPATARASFAFYNTVDDVDRLVAGLHKVIELFE
ncbi:MAG: cysteine desulfurase [Cyanobacteria bacterium HKST-UBA04]|nr:cysteine desulfurase [Cyanobacteria bacterium HKST-UBA04]